MSGSQTAAPGTWINQNINGMQYEVLLPANYDPSVKYATMLFLHQLDMGNDPADLMSWVNGWFNTGEFRADHPAIVVVPLLDQSADPSGQTINFGGVATADNPGETNAIAALKAVMAQDLTDPSRVYVTGASMGGIGTEDMMIKFNAYTGTEGKIFAAGLSMAGADYGQGYPQPNPSVVTALKNVPLWDIHGGQDTTVPLAWDQNLYAAEQAIGGIMKYTQDNSLGHDVWDTYYPQTGAGSPLSWLFSQSAKGTASSTGGTGQSGGGSVTTPKVTPSANDTVVKAGSAAAITDAAGNKWTITSTGQVAVNGTADTTTANVIELAYVNGKVWQENASKLWWDKASPADAWGPAAGTTTSPLPVVISPSDNDTVVKAGSTAAITDAAGNKWTITSTGQVAVNGAADATTANVVELAYVNGKVWQENASKLWWDKASPTDAWGPAAGTTTSPLPVVISPSANDTVVKAGSTAAITDAAGNKWTITGSGQVAVNGVADATTANVTELAYVNGKIWQENSSSLWWDKASPSDAWSPASGTSTSPLPVTIAATEASVTISQSQVSVIATAGDHMVFVTGTGDTLSLTGGKDTITDSRGGNTFVLPAAGKGYDTFNGTSGSNILTLNDTLDLRPALAATNWNGAAATLAKYLTVTDTAQGAVLSIAPTSGGAGVAIATIGGATHAALPDLLAHALT